MTEEAQIEEQAIVEASKLSRIYGSGTTLVAAVTNVNLSVFRGEILLVMGPSGSGKTTLLSLIGGLLRPTSGTIRFGGHDLTSMSESERARLRRDNIGFVFQDFNLLSALTARENVEVALNLAGITGKRAVVRAELLLDQLGLSERAGFIPAKLSGGEKQRVAIARALANDPLLILADEPTANLDSYHGLAVVHRLAEIAQDEQRTVIIVSHDERLKEIATRVMWMEDGQLSESGPPTKRLAADAAGGYVTYRPRHVDHHEPTHPTNKV